MKAKKKVIITDTATSSMSSAKSIVSAEIKTINTSLRSLPQSAIDDFKNLKSSGKVAGSMNAFIIESFLQRLREYET